MVGITVHTETSHYHDHIILLQLYYNTIIMKNATVSDSTQKNNNIGTYLLGLQFDPSSSITASMTALKCFMLFALMSSMSVCHEGVSRECHGGLPAAGLQPYIIKTQK